LARDWFRNLDQNMPGWREAVDAEALELALLDAMGDDNPRRLDPVMLDALTEFMAQVNDQRPAAVEAVREAVTGIVTDPRFPDIAQRLAAYFRRGLPLHDPTVRSERLKVLLDYVEILKPILQKVMARFANQLDARERRFARRHPLMTRPDLAKTVGSVPTSFLDMNLWAVARLTISETERQVTPEAMKGVREFLRGKGHVNQSDAARAVGISPATLTRALVVLQVHTRSELGAAPESIRLHFSEALCAAAMEKENATC
jgi:hypothetical protein